MTFLCLARAVPPVRWPLPCPNGCCPYSRSKRSPTNGPSKSNWTDGSLDFEEFLAAGVTDRSYWASFSGTLLDTADSKWPWDLYLGMVPFVEMVTLAEHGLIEPWEPYLPSGLADTWIPLVKDEATYDGQIYSYPFGTNVVAAAWHGGIVEAAGLDPEYAPSTWDEWIRSARLVMDTDSAPFGAIFNPSGWLSLAPIAHSIDGDIYSEAGLFDFTHEAVVEALEIMRRLMEVSKPDVLEVAPMPMSTDITAVEEGSAGDAFAAERAAYYFDHLYAPLNMSSGWSDPGDLRMGALPSVPGGAGGTVFWSVGAGLFIDGRNKGQAAEYLRFLTADEHRYRVDIGNGRKEIGLLHPHEPVWEQWRSDPPPWLASWAITLKDQLSRSRSIPTYKVGPVRPHWHSGVAQFEVGRPHWEAYLRGDETDPRRALESAKRAWRQSY